MYHSLASTGVVGGMDNTGRVGGMVCTMVRLMLGLTVVWIMLAGYHSMDKVHKGRWLGWLIAGSGLARKSTTPAHPHS